jgi:hypothetical protein
MRPRIDSLFFRPTQIPKAPILLSECWSINY